MATNPAEPRAPERERCSQVGGSAHDKPISLLPAPEILPAPEKEHGLPSRSLHALIGEHEVLPGLRLVAVEAGREIGIGIGSLVGAERLIYPFAIALRFGIFGAPAGALLHHGVADDIAGLDEAAAGVLHRIAPRIELRGILRDGDHGALRQRIALLGGIDRRLAGEIFAHLFVLSAVKGHVDHAFGIVRRERDLVAAGLRGDRQCADARAENRKDARTLRDACTPHVFLPGCWSEDYSTPSPEQSPPPLVRRARALKLMPDPMATSFRHRD